MVGNFARRLCDIRAFQSFDDRQMTPQGMEACLASAENLQLRGGGRLDHAGEEDTMKP
jgi:hypothetical protein